MKESSDILIGRSAGKVWIKVGNRGSFQNSAPMKSAAESFMRGGEHEFVVDLKDCPGMDSTFMGTLSGLALRLRRQNGGLHIIHPGERNRDSLVNLGLDAIMEIHEDEDEEADQAQAAEVSPVKDLPLSRDEQQRAMLEAHQSLVEAAPANYEQFEDVLHYLRKELNEGGPS